MVNFNDGLKVGTLEIELRPSQYYDIGFVYELMHHHFRELFDKFLPEKWSREKFKQGFNSDRITIVENLGMPIGFFDLELKGEEAYGRNLHISDDYEGRHIGIALVSYIERKCLDLGAKSIKGKVFSENKTSLRVLVDRRGWEVIQNIPEEHSFLLTKNLRGEND